MFLYLTVFYKKERQEIHDGNNKQFIIKEIFANVQIILMFNIKLVNNDEHASFPFHNFTHPFHLNYVSYFFFCGKKQKQKYYNQSTRCLQVKYRHSFRVLTYGRFINILQKKI